MPESKRLFVQDDYASVAESERMAAQRLMKALDEEAAKRGRVLSGEVTVMASEPSPFGFRTMRLEADTEAR